MCPFLKFHVCLKSEDYLHNWSLAFAFNCSQSSYKVPWTGFPKGRQEKQLVFLLVPVRENMIMCPF